MIRTCLIANPRSGAGGTGRRLDALRRAADAELGADWELWQTEGPGHASELARRAALAGFGRVVAVGGDGTASEVVDGLFDDDRPVRPVVFGLVHAGTGGDLRKTLNVPADPREALAVLRTAAPRPTDVLWTSLVGPDGARRVRRCINVAGFGMNGEVVERANRSSKRWGGRWTFLEATARTVATYRPSPVRISWEDADGGQGEWVGPLASAFVANGQYCGGGMWVGRGGSMQDGLADLTILPELPLLRMILGTPRLFRGTIENVKGVSRHRVRRIAAIAEGESEIRVDIDGEQPGVLPIEMRVLPGALDVAARW